MRISSIRGSMSSSTSRRTGGRPTLRRSSSFSRASSRFSASSSSTSTSSFRVTRKTWWLTTCMPLNSWSRWRAMTSSSGTKRPSPSDMNRGSTVGTLTRANWRTPGLGVLDQDREVDRQARRCTGRGATGRRPAASARGRCARRRARACARAPRGAARPSAAARCPRAASAGRISSAKRRRLLLDELTGAVQDRRVQVARQQPADARHGDAGGDAPLEPGDADHEELVQVGGEDRQELRPLEQRDAHACPGRGRGPGR